MGKGWRRTKALTTSAIAATTAASAPTVRSCSSIRSSKHLVVRWRRSRRIARLCRSTAVAQAVFGGGLPMSFGENIAPLLGRGLMALFFALTGLQQVQNWEGARMNFLSHGLRPPDAFLAVAVVLEFG